MGASLKSGERVMFYPSYGFLSSSGIWSVQIHGVAFEDEPNSHLRKYLAKSLGHLLGLSPEEIKCEIFQKRAFYFVEDNKRSRTLEISIAGQPFKLKKTGPNGHIEDHVSLNWTDRSEMSESPWLEFQFSGKAQLISPRGVSVISDIDDTIKVTQVHDRRKMIQNTFVNPFRAVPGMSGLYRGWEKSGAVFHYVSASPWQLYAPLSEWMHSEGYPQGTYHLKHFRWKDASFFSLFESPEKYKVEVLEPILQEFPGRQFVLVGDSSESDPEAYGVIARKYPGQIRKIYILDPAGSKNSERYAAAFRGVPGVVWDVFRDPIEIEGGL